MKCDIKIVGPGLGAAFRLKIRGTQGAETAGMARKSHARWLLTEWKGLPRESRTSGAGEKGNRLQSFDRAGDRIG